VVALALLSCDEVYVTGLTEGASVVGRRKNYRLWKVHSHQSEYKQIMSDSCAKRASMPCVRTSQRANSSHGNRFYSAVVDEAEEWAQVTNHHHCLHVNIMSGIIQFILLIVFAGSHLVS